jgi:hypothetical protein
MDLNGDKRATIWESATKSGAIICPSLQANVGAASFIVVPVAGVIFRVSAGFAARSPVWPAAALIHVANSMRVSGYAWLKTAKRLDSSDRLET